MKKGFVLFAFVFLFAGLTFGKNFYEVSVGICQTYTWSCCDSSWSQWPLPFFSLGIGNAVGKDEIYLIFQVHPLPMRESFRDGEYRYPDGGIEVVDEDYQRTYLVLGSYRSPLFGKFYTRAYLGFSDVIVHGTIVTKGGEFGDSFYEYHSFEPGLSAGMGIGMVLGRKSGASLYAEIFALNTEVLSFGEYGFPQIFLGFKFSAEF